MKPLFASLLVEREMSFDPFDLPPRTSSRFRGSRTHAIEALGFRRLPVEGRLERLFEVAEPA
jgi:hypothetical protein